MVKFVCGGGAWLPLSVEKMDPLVAMHLNIRLLILSLGADLWVLFRVILCN